MKLLKILTDAIDGFVKQNLEVLQKLALVALIVIVASWRSADLGVGVDRGPLLEERLHRLDLVRAADRLPRLDCRSLLGRSYQKGTSKMLDVPFWFFRLFLVIKIPIFYRTVYIW